MISFGRTSSPGNARTLLLNHRYSTSMAVTSRSIVYCGIDKNIHKSKGDNSVQTVFPYLQRRALSGNREELCMKAYERLCDAQNNPHKFDSYEEYRKAHSKAGMEFIKHSEHSRNGFEFLSKLRKSGARQIDLTVILRYLRDVACIILGILVYWTYTFVQRRRSPPENSPPNPTKHHSNWNALYPMKVENNLEKQQDYGEFKWESR